MLCPAPSIFSPAGSVKEGRVEASFFVQAEVGIRDGHVTGVQTCALPIWFISKTVASPAGKVILSGGFWARPNSQIGYTAGWEATVNGPSTDANGDATSWAVEGYSTRTAAWTL